ncbi:hypothetical protein CH333_01545 [candidate division WOR-3 bacterium JGI_Cruoil_03_44_89]|uniref:Porin domain-containing protein n=1 Tax=candidate division WOR-3 bacterium JGI_Cruoil_03_44_89 TaxID=1973748 RepID=A0A235BY20_UNCW3|nr:MAG: hypothetical protein CH333_01545 [candidate division WOR-3 bacterium JGI_Cruoil_03_44_89]
MEKWRVLMSLLGVLIASSLLAGLKGGESQIKAYSWYRYTYEQEDTDTKKNEFAVKRGYLRWEHQFTDKIKSRVTLDFFSSDKDPHGAGLKLKDTYVDLKYLIPEGKIKAGLQKTYFGLIYDWDYLTIQKALEDKEKLVSSRDYGISIGGNIPNGFGEWNLEIVNGEGYKKTGGDLNTELAYLGNIRIIPIPGITVGASVLNENAKESPYEKRLPTVGMGRVAYGPIDVWLEYLWTDRGDKDNPTNSQGYMVMPILKDVLPNLDIIPRYDHWDPNTDEEDDGPTRYILGFNYHFVKASKGKPGVMLQLNFERKQKEEEDSKPENQLLAQLRWEFATGAF